jgi:hypothetical protein
LLTWASVRALTGTQPPPIHRNGTKQSQRTGQRSALITGTIRFHDEICLEERGTSLIILKNLNWIPYNLHLLFLHSRHNFMD